MQKTVMCAQLMLSVFLLALSACGHAPRAGAAVGTQPEQTLAAKSDTRWIKSELYFGRSESGGGEVSETEWASFLDESVTRRFPLGLTVLSGHGQWEKADGGEGREPSKLVILVHEDSDDNRRKIGAIIAEYKARFDQKSVMLLTSGVDVQF